MESTIFSAVLWAWRLFKVCLLSFADPDIHNDPTFIYFGLFSWRLLGYITWILTKPFFFCSAAYEDDMDDVHSYWREYFKVFHIGLTKVCNFYLLLSKVHVFGDVFDLFLTSVINQASNWFNSVFMLSQWVLLYSPRSFTSLS